MDNEHAIQLMSALAQPTRLNVFDVLSQHRPAGLSVGDLATRVGTPPNTMSAQLAILARAGVVAQKRDGRSVSYSLVPDAVERLAAYLLTRVRDEN
ncbi:ArsR/SmtB family transcription factor [Sphingomonas beigongshangi]|jgi:ArsR family transcriptional regulator, arsenate/arsenite/antimonite-responsive transcriptional repressor|uniref:ArsR/SmtB family transcription factor n=1 Tax=Sphingomonas beigongshangi TaxID=2782540 RepID=UPI001AEED38B|nr:metalloregulator ArsR/SmtB family transcription factor [Sphingomonas beigongshangi]